MNIFNRDRIVFPVIGLVVALVSSGYAVNGIVRGVSFDSHFLDVGFYGSVLGCICAVWPVLRKAHTEARKARIQAHFKEPIAGE